MRYYPLTQADDDGRKEEMGIRAVKFDEATLDFAVYPNPLSDQLKVQILSGAVSQIKVQISNAVGQEVLKQEVELTKGNNTLDFSIGKHLPAGSYYLRMETEGSVYNKLLIKQ